MAAQRRTTKRDDRVECPVCSVKVREDNLDRHMEKTHPEGEATDAAREAMLKRKMDARRSAAMASARTVVPVVIVALLLVVLAYFVIFYETPLEHPPDFKFNDVVNGDTYDSRDYFVEGLTIVEFMHTECGNCEDLAPILGELYAEYQGNLSGMFTIGGYWLGNTQDDVISLRNFKNEHNSNWVHLFDDTGDLMGDYGTNSYPTVYFIKDDKIVYEQVGKASKSFLESLIKKYM